MSHHFAVYLDRTLYARLLHTISNAHHELDPINTIVTALGELGNLWPASIEPDPHCLPRCPCCGLTSRSKANDGFHPGQQ